MRGEGGRGGWGWGKGGHSVEAVEANNCGRTKVLYAVAFRSLLWIRVLRLRKPYPHRMVKVRFHHDTAHVILN